ncbi:hypothetical protein K2173_021647 [Erythroxylum novogranatense]|uniref:CASP-like protein n=1 Tax=Erythroxylum novogranatense TaxID=1862640 RepID=A0AAV8TIQ1_9ROSI|nr:hypothetical protein K2173_021647 [Erythroxylum novogranatense]
MKQEGEVVVLACRSMAGVLQSTNSISQHSFPTPSPFSFSVASQRPSIKVCSLLLRFLALLLSFTSAVSLAAPSTKQLALEPSTFNQYSQLMYCFIVSILVFLYSAFQLFKGICDIAHRGILISDVISDYMSFILDQLEGYLLISSCSVAILTIQQIAKPAPLWKAAIISTSMSLATFLVTAISCLLSGYKLCTRIIW